MADSLRPAEVGDAEDSGSRAADTGGAEHAAAWEEAQLDRHRAITDRIVAGTEAKRARTQIALNQSWAALAERWVAMFAFVVGIVATLISNFAMGNEVSWELRAGPVSILVAAVVLRLLTSHRWLGGSGSRVEESEQRHRR